MNRRALYLAVRAGTAAGTVAFTLLMSLQLDAQDFIEVTLTFLIAQGLALLCRQGMDRALQLLLAEAEIPERRRMLRLACTSVLRVSSWLLPASGLSLLIFESWIPLSSGQIALSVLLALPIAMVMVLGGGVFGLNRPIVGSLREPGSLLFQVALAYLVLAPFSPLNPWATCVFIFIVVLGVNGLILMMALDIESNIPAATAQVATDRPRFDRGDLMSHNRAFTMTAVSDLVINSMVPFCIALVLAPGQFEVFRVLERVASAVAFPVYLADGLYPQKLWRNAIAAPGQYGVLIRARRLVRLLLAPVLVALLIFMAGWSSLVQPIATEGWLVFGCVLSGYGLNCWFGVEPYRLFVRQRVALWGRIVVGSALVHLLAAILLTIALGWLGAALSYAISFGGRYLFVWQAANSLERGERA